MIEPLVHTDSTTFRSIFESANEGILLVDDEGIILMVNKSGSAIFAYDTGELVGLNIDTLIPKQHQSAHVAHRKVYTENPSPRHMGAGRDLQGLRKDGSVFPLEVSLSHIQMSDRMLVVAFVIDISARKKIEEALRQSEEQLITYATELESRVKKRTEELDHSVKKLKKEVEERKRIEKQVKEALAKEKDLNELKSRFVSMASHEFRTPLSTILSSGELIRKYREMGVFDKMDKHIVRILASVQSLNGILNDFLSLDKIEEGKVRADLHTTNLNEIFLSVVTDMEGMTKVNQTIEVLCPIDLYIVSDANVLKNIFINLISNSIKYSNDGDHIIIKAFKEGDDIVISISDQGIGIPVEDQKGIFDRFFRASNVINIQGTGLGLNIVRKYLDMLNGSISFISEPNVGTTFTIVLPVNIES